MLFSPALSQGRCRRTSADAAGGRGVIKKQPVLPSGFYLKGRLFLPYKAVYALHTLRLQHLLRIQDHKAFCHRQYAARRENAR